ncbi:hypothetical protein DMENIID0001_053550 [Sergentomyia squamirostris]
MSTQEGTDEAELFGFPPQEAKGHLVVGGAGKAAEGHTGEGMRKQEGAVGGEAATSSDLVVGGARKAAEGHTGGVMRKQEGLNSILSYFLGNNLFQLSQITVSSHGFNQLADEYSDRGNELVLSRMSGTIHAPGESCGIFVQLELQSKELSHSQRSPDTGLKCSNCCNKM